MLLVLESAQKAGLIPKAKKYQSLLLSVFFSFGTVFFYLSNVGSVWFTSQIVAIEMLLISLIFLFKYASGKKNILFIGSIFFLCLAFWSRNTLLFAFPVHLYVLFMISKKDKLKLFLVASLLLLFSIIGFGFYNFFRFGSFTENGLRYQTFNARWSKDVKTYGLSNIHYFPHNIYYFLVNPITISTYFPYFKADPEGNGIFYTSPFFLALFGFVAVDIYKRKNRAALVFLATGLLLIFSQLFYYGTGWVQFGYRYALDGIPFLILALAWVFGIIPSIILYVLFLLSVVMNTFGVFWMQKMTEKLLY